MSDLVYFCSVLKLIEFIKTFLNVASLELYKFVPLADSKGKCEACSVKPLPV